DSPPVLACDDLTSMTPSSGLNHCSTVIAMGFSLLMVPAATAYSRRFPRALIPSIVFSPSETVVDHPRSIGPMVIPANLIENGGAGTGGCTGRWAKLPLRTFTVLDCGSRM